MEKGQHKKRQKTTVIIIRHGEKLAWKEGCIPDPAAEYKDDHHLSAKVMVYLLIAGYERAQALVGYFGWREEMRRVFEQRELALVRFFVSDSTLSTALNLLTKGDCAGRRL